jgi:hypothetical protein
MANSVSVAVGESETMRRGCLGTVTSPLDATTVTGNADGDDAPPYAPDTATASAASPAATRRTNERST